MPFRNDPQLRILPDTNAWLDAAFWPGGVARRAFDTLQAERTPIIIEELIQLEAGKILSGLRGQLGLSFDPVQFFDAFTAAFLHVPPAALAAVNVNKADQPVARAALHYQATILTQDAPLVAECLSDGILARFPWEMIIKPDEAPPPEEILRVVPPNRHIGTIFARVTPGGWQGLSDVGNFTVVDVHNVGRLWFDSKTAEWVYDSAQSARMKFAAAGQGQSLIAATYDFPTSGLGKIILRAFSPNTGEISTQTINTMKRLRDGCGEIRVGASIYGDAYWNGVIRHLTISPEGMSAPKWKAICEVPNAAPNPLNAGALRLGLLAMDGR